MQRLIEENVKLLVKGYFLCFPHRNESIHLREHPKRKDRRLSNNRRNIHRGTSGKLILCTKVRNSEIKGSPSRPSRNERKFPSAALIRTKLKVVIPYEKSFCTYTAYKSSPLLPNLQTIIEPSIRRWFHGNECMTGISQSLDGLMQSP